MKQRVNISSYLFLLTAICMVCLKPISAQQIDIPHPPTCELASPENGNPEILSMEQQFSSSQYANIQYNDITDEHSIKVYSASELRQLISSEIHLEYIKAFKELNTPNGNPLFDARDIVKFYQNHIELSDLEHALGKVSDYDRNILISELYKQEYKNWKSSNKGQPYIFSNSDNFKTISCLGMISYSYSFFKDTKKPNLLIIYPSIDETRSFFSSSSRKMIQTLSETYDIWFATTANEKDLYTAIRKTPDIELLILSGHGSTKSIQLGDSFEGFEELSYIDINDTEFMRYLSRLNANATIFLNSCSTGDGKETQNNLANTISRFAPGRNVISTTAPFSNQEVVIQTSYPLQISIPEKLYISCK